VNRAPCSFKRPSPSSFEARAITALLSTASLPGGPEHTVVTGATPLLPACCCSSRRRGASAPLLTTGQGNHRLVDDDVNAGIPAAPRACVAGCRSCSVRTSKLHSSAATARGLALCPGRRPLNMRMTYKLVAQFWSTWLACGAACSQTGAVWLTLMLLHGRC
jgi:hypothetical protein